MEEKIEELIGELKLTNKLLINYLLKENNLTDNVKLLGNFGLQPKDIAFYLHTTPNNIRVQKNKINNKGKKK